MKWRGRKGGGQIEDRRGQGGGGLGTGGMPFPIPMGKGGGGIGMLLIVLLLVFVLPRCLGSSGGGFGIDPGTDPLPQSPQAGSGDLNEAPADDPAKFVDFVAGDVDATWKRIFSQSNQTYEQPVVVLYDDAVRSACGTTPSTVGPFYCPLDKKVYLDLPFLQQLQQRLGAPGDFAQAYVIAHEIGHHVQNLLGVMEDVNLERQENPGDANELSVRLELQADCLAGVWAHSAYKQDLLESGDLEEGLNAASAVGDDRIQEGAGQRVNPESFTHGTGEQRVRWFRAGFDGGDPTACDTFKGDI
jgi:predicted metalloprotease